MIIFRKINQTINSSTKLFRTKLTEPGDSKTVFSKWKRGLVVLTTTSTWLWVNSSVSPTTGRRQLDMFSSKARESGSKILFSVLSFFIQEQQEMVDMEGTNYKERLPNLMIDTMLQKNRLMMNSDKEYLRATRIANSLMQSNLEMKLHSPRFHITSGSSLQAFSLARNIILSKGTLEKWNDSQLAFIIGHEMSHHVLDHHVENLSWLCVEMLVTIMVFVYIIKRRMLMLALGWIFLKPFRLMISYPMRRLGEVEADDLGMEMMSMACYDMREVIKFWQMLEFFSPMGKGVLAMVSDHPSHMQRMERMQERMEEMVTLRKEAGCGDLENSMEKVLSATSK